MKTGHISLSIEMDSKIQTMKDIPQKRKKLSGLIVDETQISVTKSNS